MKQKHSVITSYFPLKKEKKPETILIQKKTQENGLIKKKLYFSSDLKIIKSVVQRNVPLAFNVFRFWEIHHTREYSESSDKVTFENYLFFTLASFYFPCSWLSTFRVKVCELLSQSSNLNFHNECYREGKWRIVSERSGPSAPTLCDFLQVFLILWPWSPLAICYTPVERTTLLHFCGVTHNQVQWE